MIEFRCKGHINTLSNHRNTIEFTREEHLTLNGDCILGVSAEKLPKAIEGDIKITLVVDDLEDSFTAVGNPKFTSTEEMVIRKTDFHSDRTFAFHASKAAKDIMRELVNKMKNPDCIMLVRIEKI